ncbi:Bifunctional chorismate mutase/prephenate dehydratase [subsurface metagenome]
MSLEELRRKIDEADDKIVRLIAERIRIAEEIGGEKKKQGKQIEDIAREQEVLKKIRGIAQKENISQEDIERIYHQIIAIAKSVEGILVAFQGEPGAYSEEAAFQYFGSSIQAKPCESVDDVFAAVEQGEVQFGIVPIENSLEGSISRSYDLLLDSKLRVRGETELRIVHYLIASPETRLDSIKKVYSHPQALGQCRAFIRQLDCEIIPTYDTAGSVKMIKERGITDGAAIASARAAEIYQMQIIAKGIEDNQNNFTRFFILAEQDSQRARLWAQYRHRACL